MLISWPLYLAKSDPETQVIGLKLVLHMGSVIAVLSYPVPLWVGVVLLMARIEMILRLLLIQRYTLALL